ncbi:transcriptional regulator [Alkalihalophilus pseudofirmus]|uniref:ArsR/SmtB family transcription factor n=1 Tax=Alkalihalobacterium alkalinitrilicum TaxID=427920 RepID=UPI00094C456C|nr:metalloregulator ArsR/SmtB family transcription factor [Alkalihalobacterium alkalinitrilicum]OLO28522.1 transcriptional regulator [Alkalihalophilus pseudofirmus]
MGKADQCEIFQYDREKVDRLSKLVEAEPFDLTAKIFKALADETRLKIAYLLASEEELCVCDIATIIGASTATASHHLRLLKNIGLAKFRKEGKLVFYSLDDNHVKQLILNGIEHGKEGKVHE